MAISNIRAGTRAASLDYDARKENLLAQLRGQYDAVVGVEPRFAYSGRKSDLDKIFESQAVNLARKGVNDLTELGQGVDAKGKKTLINKNTGEELYKIVRDPDIKVDKWAEKGKGVKGIAAFSVKFDEEGRGLFLPVYEESTAFGGPLADLVVPAATIAGAYFLGPAFAGSLGASGGAAAGAAIGSSGGQLAATGEIDPMKTLLSAGTAYVGSEIFGGGAPAETGVDYSLTGGGVDVGGTGFQVPAGDAVGYSLAPDVASTGLNLSPADLAPGIGASLTPVIPSFSADYSLLGGTSPDQLASMGETGLLSGTPGEGLQLPTTPALPGMGGGQGLVVPVEGGLVTETGFTPAGATPVLGDPGSFINDPNVLGQPVIEDVAAGMTGAEVLRNLSRLSRLSGLLSEGGPGSAVGGSLTGGTPGRGVSYNLPSFTPTRINLPSFAPMVDLGLTEQQIQGLLSQPNPLPSFSLLR
jgi:hypothetical protein